MYDYICPLRRSQLAHLYDVSDKVYGNRLTGLHEKKQDNLSIALPNLTLNYVQMNTYTSAVDILL